MKNMGLKINVNKTKIKLFEGKCEKTVCDIALNYERIEQVDEKVYLRSLFITDREIDGEIERPINEGNKIISKVGTITRSKNITN